MNVNNLVLLNSLSFIINEGITSSDYSIAEYLLRNIHNIERITVNKIVDEAFVSRSAIRRFCNSLGYENFTDLKNSLSDIIFPSNIHLRKFKHIKTYKAELIEGLSEMIDDINKSITNADIDHIVELINQYEDISIISANNTSSNLLKFQQELFYAKKIIKLVSNHVDNIRAENFTKNKSLIIIVSVSGVFAKAINNIVKGLNGKKVLITAYRNQCLEKTYDQIFYISNKTNTKNNQFWIDKMGLYGKYGVTYIFDLISEHYIYKYHNNRKED